MHYTEVAKHGPSRMHVSMFLHDMHTNNDMHTNRMLVSLASVMPGSTPVSIAPPFLWPGTSCSSAAVV